ncbi:MAG: S-layer homology domain-containing protein [Clostridiales Family XIII bacterium]|jgi:hypothetical protein|nr:S-layer homology domain-containing protein [Clostridiales Family XIII bacterium]
MLIKRIKIQAAWLLAVIMLIGQAAPASFAAASESDVRAALTRTFTDYYQGAQEGVLSDWEDLAAAYISGKNLREYSLPPTGATTSTALILSLLKGDMPAANEYATVLATDGLTTRYYTYSDALELIAMEAYNRAAGSAAVSYDENTAIGHLLSAREQDGGFGFGSGGDPDTTGIVLAALAPFNNNAYPDVQKGIIDALSYLHKTQQSNGGFLGTWSGNNSQSAAVVLWGLDALGEDIAGDWAKNGFTPVDALLSFQTPSGGFGLDNAIADDTLSTRQAALALAQIESGQSIFTDSISNVELYKSLSAGVVGEDGKYYERSVTARNDETLSDVIARAMRTSSADSNEYYCYRGGKPIVGGPVYVSGFDDGADILTIHKDFEYVTYFKAETGDRLGVNGTEIPFGGSATLTLMITSAAAVSYSAPLAGVGVDINSDGFDEGVTDSNGNVTLSGFIGAGVHDAVVLPGRVIDKDVTAMLPAKITMNKASAVQTATVGVRVEGIYKNILHMPAITVGNDGDKVLTVLDAVKDALDYKGITYTEIGGYISSVDGVSEKPDAGIGWLYNIVSDEAYLKGEKWPAGMGSQPIKDGDEIVVYYGNWLSFPIIETKLNADGGVTVAVKMWVTDWSTGIATLSPVSDVSVLWAENTAYAFTYNTDANGEIVIPPAKAPVGKYTLQIDKKDASDLPAIMRLAPDYAIEVKGGSVAPSTPTAPKTDDVYITVTGPSGNLFARKAFSWYAGVTPLSVLRRTGLTYETDAAGAYVKSIGGFAEFDYGPNSGWLYKVNGVETIKESAAVHRLNSGDELEWFYTRDYTKESGSGAWSTATPAPADDEEKVSSSLSETAAANGAAAFDDVKAADWFYDDVEYAVKNGIFNGISADKFGPNIPMTRGMIVTVLGRLEGVNESSYTGGGFSDVAPGQYYTAYAEWAKANGIVNGVGENMFAPDGNVSRQDFAVMLTRYAELSQKDIRATRDPITFSDEADIADYAKQAVQDLYSGEIINGVGGNAFNPKGSATRAEAAAMLRRFIEN